MNSLTGGMQTIPNVAADLTTSDTWIFQLFICNKTAGAITVTITDKAASAKSLLAAKSIGANDFLDLNFPEGLLMTGGINWVASGADSLDASIVGWTD